MELIIDFYKSLDTLNLIIFWGIIIVIILLLVFSSILLNKNKKLKQIVEKVNKIEEDLPIKKNEVNKIIEDKKNNNILPIKEQSENEQQTSNKTIETEKEFIAEEHVIGYKNEISKTDDNNQINEQPEYKITPKKEFEIPSKPYQRNVLREMSLSQTSPIGITIPKEKEDRKVEMAKELQESLNASQDDMQVVREISKEKKEQLKKELTNIEDSSPRKTEIRLEKKYIQTQNTNNNIEKEKTNINSSKKYNYNNEERNFDKSTKKYIENNQPEKIKIDNFQNNQKNEEKIENKINSNINEELIAAPVKELLNSVTEVPRNSMIKSSSEKYLEEVSRKLSEAEITDDIERTDYELEQEENAIISYKELMEKKDSIQTIDEEEAIISIEELMNRNNKQEEIQIKEDTKLYKITEEEENDEFLNQLKQFRNDL